MKSTDKDILNSLNLKKMPFDTPEGYFERFKAGMKKEATPRSGIWNRFAPYAGLAAAFLSIFAIGTAILERSVEDTEMIQDDYLVFFENMPVTTIYEIEEEVQLADAAMNEEDIINYLIYSGITAEELEQYK